MTIKVNVEDVVNIQTGDEKGRWGIVKKIAGDEYHVATYGGTDVKVYGRREITKSRKYSNSLLPPVEEYPEVSETSSEVSKGVTPTKELQLPQDPENSSRSPGQLKVITFDLARVRSINDSRTFLEATYKGERVLISIEGLTFGKVADIVAGETQEEV